MQSKSSRGFLEAALDAIQESQTGAEDMIDRLEALSADVQRAQDAFRADLRLRDRYMRVESWLWAIPASASAAWRYAMSAVPFGPFPVGLDRYLWGVPSSCSTVRRYAMNLFPLGPFLEDPLPASSSRMPWGDGTKRCPRLTCGSSSKRRMVGGLVLVASRRHLGNWGHGNVVTGGI